MKLPNDKHTSRISTRHTLQYMRYSTDGLREQKLAPMDSMQIKANIKVTSTETGVIFGNIVYDAGLERKVVVLADVHLDVIDWISPATTADVSFRAMWA